MTQNFTVVENQTQKKGVNVPLKETVADVRAILDGKVDQLKPEDLLFIGTLKDIEQKLQEIKPAPAPAVATPGATPADQTQQSPDQQKKK